jgi:hypothetical protein
VNATFAKADQPSIFSPQAAAAGDTSSHSLSYSKLDNIKQTTTSSSAKPQSSSKKDMSLDLQ